MEVTKRVLNERKVSAEEARVNVHGRNNREQYRQDSHCREHPNGE